MTGDRLPIIMGQQITLRVCPGQFVNFPNRCVACGQAATSQTTLQNRRGQITRSLDVPLCAECAHQLTRRSGQEERRIRAGIGAAIFTAVAAMAFLFIAIDFWPWWLRFLVAVLVALSIAYAVYRLAVQVAQGVELPEKRVVRSAVIFKDFSWRDLILEIEDPVLAAEIKAANGESGDGFQPMTDSESIPD